MDLDSKPIGLYFNTRYHEFGNLYQEIVDWVLDNYGYLSKEVELTANTNNYEPEMFLFQDGQVVHNVEPVRELTLIFNTDESFNLFNLMFSGRYQKYVRTQWWGCDQGLLK